MALNIPTEGTKLNELKINIVDTQETFDAMVIANKVESNQLYFIEQEEQIGPSDITGLATLTIGTATCQVFASNNITIPIYDGTIENTLSPASGGNF